MAAPKTKTEKVSGHQQVVAFLDQLEHPFKREIQEVRNIILLANQHLTEHIKWNAPSFCYHEEDRVTFNLQGKDHFKLIFHCGAKVKANKPTQPLFDDATGLLQWITPDRAIAQFTDMNDVAAKKTSLVEVVSKWIAATR